MKRSPAFMDGKAELPAESITASIHNDAELFGAWRRYHLVGDSLRGQLPAQFPATDLSARISRALESEPAILSPQRRTATVSQRILKPAAGLAIAASVALVAIIGLRGMDHTAGTGSTTGDTTVAATDAAATAPAPERIEVQAPRQSLQPAAPSQLARTVSTEAVPGDYQQSGQAAGQYRFNSYLINHNEYRVNSGVHGSMPYARIVAPYGSNQ
ncbi:MAG: sigma-E factor negative regulatory protein [Gammaproteobacteria bacterium]|nr:sigma-E factor negative regulatory protein [Gammaproteobacteria bacterium]